jgi:hypothetical protein
MIKALQLQGFFFVLKFSLKKKEEMRIFCCVFEIRKLFTDYFNPFTIGNRLLNEIDLNYCNRAFNFESIS